MVTQEQKTKLVLGSTFLGLLVGFSGLVNRGGASVQLRPFDLAQLGLATYRTGRLVAYERVAAPIREPFTETVPDASGTGEAVVATGKGWRWALGELMSCPVCIGTWVAAGLVYGLHLAPVPTRVYLAIMSSTGVAQILSDTTEALSWTARASRKEATPVEGV